MARDIRFVPPRSLQHVVDTTFQGRYFLVPSEELNGIVAGVLGRAQREYGMEICAVVVAANHIHLLLRPRDAAHLAAFMCFLKTNLAKEIGSRLRGWHGRFFEGRYRSITVSSEPMAQAAVLRYILSHGPKEGLVDRAQDWPGIHSAKPLIQGHPIVGHWHDRTQERKKYRTAAPTLVTREVIHLSPLPAFKHLPTHQWRQFIKEMVQEINSRWAAQRKLEGRQSLGVAKVMAVNPEFRPQQRERSPKPRFHFSDRKVLKALMELWRQVITAYKEASENLRADRQPRFPEGTFPPALPFVAFSADGLLNSRGRPC